MHREIDTKKRAFDSGLTRDIGHQFREGNLSLSILSGHIEFYLFIYFFRWVCVTDASGKAGGWSFFYVQHLVQILTVQRTKDIIVCIHRARLSSLYCPLCPKRLSGGFRAGKYAHLCLLYKSMTCRVGGD
jgi:hypothetical protein